MKTTLSMILMTALLLPFSYGQDAVPQAAKDALKQMYPKAKKVSWEQEDQGYEAEFKVKGKEVSVVFSEDGEWMQTETSMSKDDLPAAVKTTLADDFEGYEVEEAELVEIPGEDNVYELELENEEEDMEIEVLISEDGRVMKKSMEEEDDEDEEDEEDEK